MFTIETKTVFEQTGSSPNNYVVKNFNRAIHSKCQTPQTFQADNRESKSQCLMYTNNLLFSINLGHFWELSPRNLLLDFRYSNSKPETKEEREIMMSSIDC